MQVSGQLHTLPVLTPDAQTFWKKTNFLPLPEIDVCLIFYKKFIKHRYYLLFA
jgi:hypothetical protein